MDMQSNARAGRRATIHDVADRAGVSRQTVTRAMNDMPGISAATRVRVLAVADELTYRPSRSGRALVGNEPPVLGLLVDDLANAFFPELATAVIRCAAARGWNTVVGETGRAGDPRAVGAELARRVDALLGYRLPGGIGAKDLGRMPLVHLDASANDARAGVQFLSGTAMASLADHLHKCGVRTAAVADLRDPGDRLPSPRALRMKEALQVEGIDVSILGSVERSASDQVRALLSGRGIAVDAIIGWNDVHALAILKELRRRRIRVPEDVRVVGVDGLALGTLVSPEITTIGVDLTEVARAGVELVEGIYTGRIPAVGPSALRTVDYSLILRESA